ncbi:hypothetical protein Pla111_08230 [Botrimarina hoheduenensis]|uniref:Uncharacterized protein n=1 Tax=Botrimarina hoheduenensis TaxID=2528000 RepID=A0A5C5WB22_9BACT|nr:hypothetical protein Pla111_08230 [Botrimarina hoheduenensis]
MIDRDRIYIELLRNGLLVLRQAIEHRDFDWAFAEVEFLHNLPTLIGELNEERHAYFKDQECELYDSRIAKLKCERARRNPKVFYADLLEELRNTRHPT